MMWHFHFVLLVCLLVHASAQDADCDFTAQVTPGQTLHVHSLLYPYSDPPSRRCLWVLSAPTGYRVRIACPLIDIREVPGCVKDVLLIFRTGDYTGSEGETLCGYGTALFESTAQKMAVGFITSDDSFRSRFNCEVTAVQDTAAPPCKCGYKYEAEYTMLAWLSDLQTSTIKCGGVIISNRHVLTSAHCLQHLIPNRTAVVVGDNKMRTDETSEFIQKMILSDIYTHPLFESLGNEYNIGVVQTEAEIAFNEGVGPVCLPFGRTTDSFTGSIVTTFSWRLISDVLTKVELNVINQDTCRKSRADLTQRQICTKTRELESCRVLSGSPLLWTDPNSTRLYSVAISNQDNVCDITTPQLNIRTTEFLDWIKTVTPNAIYCKP